MVKRLEIEHVLKYLKENMTEEEASELTSWLRYKGLRDRYEILALILAHEMRHALAAKNDPSFHVHRKNRMEELSRIYLNDYLKSGNFADSKAAYAQFLADYPEYGTLITSITLEEVEKTYPFEKEVEDELKELAENE